MNKKIKLFLPSLWLALPSTEMNNSLIEYTLTADLATKQSKHNSFAQGI